MKNKSNLLKLALLFAPVLLLPASCSKDQEAELVGVGERGVEMTIQAPSASTRGEISAESVLKDITLLVFDGSTDASKFLYSRYAWKTSVANKYQTTMKIGNGVTVYFAANAKDLIEQLETAGHLVEETTTWIQAKELLMLETPTAFDLAGKGLPMWGHKNNVNIADAPNNNLNTVTLLRAVASADIIVTDSSFDLEKGHLAFAANKGYLAYDPSMLSGSQVSGPVSPSDMQTNVEWSAGTTGSQQINNVLYMYENDTPLTPTGTNRPTKVILEGKWKGGGTSFYPISLRNLHPVNQDYEKQQATRNNKYLIVINSVNGDGWETLDDAKDADDANIEYEVITWNEKEDPNIYIDGNHYFSISDKEVWLGYKKHTDDVPNTYNVTFSTNYDLNDIKISFNSASSGGSGPDENSRFKAEITTVGGYNCFRFTALADYMEGATDNPSILYVTINQRFKFTITVTQLPKDPGLWEDGGDTGADL